jgi:hypothetical protein
MLHPLVSPALADQRRRELRESAIRRHISREASATHTSTSLPRRLLDAWGRRRAGATPAPTPTPELALTIARPVVARQRDCAHDSDPAATTGQSLSL